LRGTAKIRHTDQQDLEIIWTFLKDLEKLRVQSDLGYLVILVVNANFRYLAKLKQVFHFQI